MGAMAVHKPLRKSNHSKRNVLNKILVTLTSLVLLTAHTCENENPETWRPLIEQYFPAEQHETAMRIMTCESSGIHHSRNPNNKHVIGLFQIHWDNLYAPVSGAYTPSWQPIIDREPALLGRKDKRFLAQDQNYIIERLQDPALNIELAAALVADRGWGDWECKP